MTQVTTGQTRPFIHLRDPLREHFQEAFPSIPGNDVIIVNSVERIMTFLQPHIQNIRITQEELSNPRVNLQKTIESVLRNFCENFLRILFDDSIQHTEFATQAFALLKKLNDEFGSLLHYLFTGGQTARERIVNRIIVSIIEIFQFR